MTGIELLKQTITWKRNSYSNELKTATLIAMLNDSTFQDSIEYCMSLEYHSEEQSKYKTNMLPLYYVCGTFNDNSASDNNIATYTNLMTVDIDFKDNTLFDLEDTRTKLFELPYVLGVYKSASGKGIFAIVRVEDGKYTSDYYKYIAKLWSYKFNVLIDCNASNPARARYISDTRDWQQWTKLNEEVQAWKLKYIEPEIKQQEQVIKQVQYNTDLEFTRKAIWAVLNSGYSLDRIVKVNDNKYGAWYHCACDFCNFSDGLDMFIKLSTNSTQYNDSINDITKKYKNAIPSDINEVSKKWCGMAKNQLGKNWYKYR